MDYINLTAPCGLFCGVCYSFKKDICKGCREEDGKCIVTKWNDNKGECKVFVCTEKKGIHNCSECDEFPCDNLHPYLDMADKVYHNQKVFNLCLIKKLGLEKWAQEKAEKVHDTYFNGKWHL